VRWVDPVGAGDAIRARVPDVLRTYQETRVNVIERGVVDADLKRLCARYLSGDPDVVAFEDGDRYDERERAALGWAQAIAWDPASADDELWMRLHRHFTEPELVELGYCMAIVHGQLRWMRALGVPPRHEDALGY
jgi:alkylhydroperoxidase family enzyme